MYKYDIIVLGNCIQRASKEKLSLNVDQKANMYY